MVWEWEARYELLYNQHSVLLLLFLSDWPFYIKAFSFTLVIKVLFHLILYKPSKTMFNTRHKISFVLPLETFKLILAQRKFSPKPSPSSEAPKIFFKISSR